MTARRRCCGTWLFWRVPFGPWRCAGRCGRAWGWRPIPKSAIRRFDWAADELADKVATAERAARETGRIGPWPVLPWSDFFREEDG